MAGPDERDRYQLRDLEGRRFNYFHVSKLKWWPDTDNLDDDYYVVDKIVDSRVQTDGRRHYRVRWRGYSKRHDTWEELENLNEAAAAEARQFDARQEAVEMADDEAAKEATSRPRSRSTRTAGQDQHGPSGPPRMRGAVRLGDGESTTGRTTTSASGTELDEQRKARDRRVAARGHRFH